MNQSWVGSLRFQCTTSSFYNDIDLLATSFSTPTFCWRIFPRYHLLNESKMITRKKAKSNVAVIDHGGKATECDGITAATASLPLVQRPDTAKQEGNIEEQVTKQGAAI